MWELVHRVSSNTFLLTSITTTTTRTQCNSSNTSHPAQLDTRGPLYRPAQRLIPPPPKFAAADGVPEGTSEAHRLLPPPNLPWLRASAGGGQCELPPSLTQRGTHVRLTRSKDAAGADEVVTERPRFIPLSAACELTSQSHSQDSFRRTDSAAGRKEKEPRRSRRTSVSRVGGGGGGGAGCSLARESESHSAIRPAGIWQTLLLPPPPSLSCSPTTKCSARREEKGDGGAPHSTSGSSRSSSRSSGGGGISSLTGANLKPLRIPGEETERTRLPPSTLKHRPPLSSSSSSLCSPS